VFFKTILLGDRSSGGGSTIIQQLVKNLYGRDHHNFLSMPINKVKEAIIASRRRLLSQWFRRAHWCSFTCEGASI